MFANQMKSGLRSSALVQSVLVAVLAGTGFGADSNPNPCGGSIRLGEESGGTISGESSAVDRGLFLEPIDGLTTARHPAPQKIAVPAGANVMFFQPACSEDSVVWEGAEPTMQFDNGWMAVVNTDFYGSYVVRSSVYGGNGDAPSADNTCIVEVVQPPVRSGGASRDIIRVATGQLTLNDDSTNGETVRYFHGSSVASLRRVAKSTFRTSVNRQVRLIAPSETAMFLTEWRINDVAIGLGPEYRNAFSSPGTYTISAGAPGTIKEIAIEVYRTRIISHRTGRDILPQGRGVTLQAETDPPGIESDITWLASTIHGTGLSVVGRGPTFTVQFDDTFREHVNGTYYQWLGVKADHAVFSQTQIRDCLPGADGTGCVEGIPPPLEFERPEE